MNRTKNQSISLRLGWIALAFLFFWNPNVSVFDFLPDFIGYLLLSIGLSKIADLNESIEDASSLFRKMILVDLGKWLAILWIFGLGTPAEQSSSLLLFTFVFAKAAEAVTNMFNHKEQQFDLAGMFDGRIPLYADEAVTAEFKSSQFPFLCAQNYLDFTEAESDALAGCDPLLLLFEALKWCFRLSCHYAVTVVENHRKLS